MRRLGVTLLLLVSSAAPAEAGLWHRLFHGGPSASRRSWLADPRNEPRSRHPLLALPGGFVPAHGSQPLLPSDVAQGKVKDCWLMAPLPGMLKIEPSALDSLVKQRADGNYDVTLYLGKKVRDARGVEHRAPITIGVTPTFPTKNGIAIYAGAAQKPGGHDLRIALIEKAYAKFEGRYEGKPPLVTRGISGRVNPAFEALLPMGESRTHLVAFNKAKTIGADLASAFSTRKPVTALLLTTLLPSTRKVFERLGLTVRFHHYAVTAYDEARGVLELQDPHGKRIPDVSLADFKKVFATYVIGPEVPVLSASR